MHRVDKIEVFGRNLRTDDKLEELGKSSYEVLREMVRRGDDKEKILGFIDYIQDESKWLHDLYCDWCYADMDYVAKTFGEEELPKMLRHVREILMKASYRSQGKIELMDNIRLFAEAMRVHRSGVGERGNIKIWEEEDRYVMEFDPCGSGGRQRRVGEIDGILPRTGEPFNMGCTSKAYDWSWQKKGVPYYCLHCCIWHEVMMIEQAGFPARITDYQDDPNQPCRWYFYKDPKNVPEEYYIRVGLKKHNKLKKQQVD
jgi:hypothetical protein